MSQFPYYFPKNILSLNFASVSVSFLMSMVEEVEGIEELLAQHLLSRSGQGSVSLDFVPKDTVVVVCLSYHSMIVEVLLSRICVSIPVMQSAACWMEEKWVRLIIDE